MIITIQIGPDNIIHSNIKCEGENFKRARECIILAKQELEEQLKNQNKCPMHEK